MNRRLRLRLMSRPQSPPRKPPPPVANLRPTKKCRRRGPNTVCEASLYSSGSCRSRRDPRLHRRPFAARCAAGSITHSGSHRPSVAASQHWYAHKRSGHPPHDNDALPIPDFLRSNGERDHHSCRAARGARSVRDARLRLKSPNFLCLSPLAASVIEIPCLNCARTLAYQSQRRSPPRLTPSRRCGARSSQPAAVLQIEKPRRGTPGFSGLSDQHLGEFDRSHSTYSTGAGSSILNVSDFHNLSD